MSETETEQVGAVFNIEHYPRVVDDAVEDEAGNVEHTACLIQTTFGMGTPVVQVQFAEPEPGSEDMSMHLTVGDLTAIEAAELLELAAYALRTSVAGK